MCHSIFCIFVNLRQQRITVGLFSLLLKKKGNCSKIIQSRFCSGKMDHKGHKTAATAEELAKFEKLVTIRTFTAVSQNLLF